MKLIVKRLRFTVSYCQGFCDIRFSTWISFSQASYYAMRAVLIFFENLRYFHSSRCTTGVIVDTGDKWKKSSIIKVFIISFWHLWAVELAYRYIFSFKFTLSCQLSAWYSIVPIVCHRWQNCCWYCSHWLQICHWYQQHQRNWWQNFPLVLLIPVANLLPASLIPVVLLGLQISPRIFEKIWNDPSVIFRGLGEDDSCKNLMQKISWHCPFKALWVWQMIMLRRGVRVLLCMHDSGTCLFCVKC